MVSKKKNEKFDFLEKIKKNPWKSMTFVLSVLTVVLLGTLMVSGNSLSSKQLSSKQAGELFVDYINSMGAAQIEYVDSADFSDGLYQVTILAEGNEIPVHITKDGKYLVQGVMPLVQQEVEVQEVPKQDISTIDIPKIEKPLIELFVMTHCPYGTQAEKGFIPTARLLQDVADVKVRFVHYFMHTNNQEEVETPRQVCIREEQSEKYWDYLECFLSGTYGLVEEALACEVQVGIDSDALADCIDSGRADEYYAEDSELSEQYGIAGSPSFVVNGVKIGGNPCNSEDDCNSGESCVVVDRQGNKICSLGRDSTSYLESACGGFEELVGACSEEVSSESPSPGFGYSGSGSATTAQC